MMINIFRDKILIIKAFQQRRHHADASFIRHGNPPLRQAYETGALSYAKSIVRCAGAGCPGTRVSFIFVLRLFNTIPRRVATAKTDAGSIAAGLPPPQSRSRRISQAGVF
jgi:hypothetical protein